MKVSERAAIFVVAFFLVVGAAFADDTKPRVADGSASAAAKASAAADAAGASDTISKGAKGAEAATVTTDAAAASGTSSDAATTPASSPADATAPPVPPSASASGSSSVSSSASSSPSSPASSSGLARPNAGAGQAKAAMADEDSELPKFTPMPALDGNPGLFLLETGETLPKHGWSLGIGLNKFSRMPGDITSLQLVPSFGYGATNWLSLFFQINSYDYIHVGEPSLLSLAPGKREPAIPEHDL